MPHEPVAAPTDAVVHLTLIQWLISAAACLGFAFDLYETPMLPLIVPPVLTDLGRMRAGTPAFNLWVGLLFLILIATGGCLGFSVAI